MLDKSTTIEDALKNICDGSTIMFGGFGVPGTPFSLIDGIIDLGVTGLTLIKNEANEDGMGLSKLIEAGRAKKLVTSHLGLNATVIGMMNRGEIEVEFYPQGILAEKIRAGGAGLQGILTDIGIGTILEKKKEVMSVNGKLVIVEPALRADVALVHAAVADRFGNLVYKKSARNFNPAMATAAEIVIAETEKLVEVGELDPDQIHTPGVFVDHIVVLDKLSKEYGILERHVL
jgi:acetate CoA/acetoacetate CoA-transferase alpha subunit